ncbi:MAG: CaiB/BaiF CoA-transferase family protein [Saprospiraceae bacterium]
MFQQHQIFKNLKVIELASVLAGPAVGMFFAELGAEVIKIENKLTGGDTTRHWKLPQEDKTSPASAYFHAVNWHKRHIFMDLAQPDDRAQLIDLVKNADIVISNFKPGSAAKLGLDCHSLRDCNPRLIYASVSAYGEDDLRPGFDVAIQAETGWMYMNGEPGGPPVKMPVALMDLLAAHQLKEGILLALLQRERTGEGREVTVSLFDAGVASLANQATNWLNAGHLPQRRGSQHPNIAPYGEIFYTKDNKPLIVATGTEEQFRQLCKIIGLPELADDERFKTNSLRLANRAALNEKLSPAFREMIVDEILASCQKLQVPVAPIRNLKEVFNLPAAKELILEETNTDGTISLRVRTAVFEIK